MTFDVQSTCVNFLKFLEDPNEQYYCLPYVVFFVWCIIATIGFIVYFGKCCFGEGIQPLKPNGSNYDEPDYHHLGLISHSTQQQTQPKTGDDIFARTGSMSSSRPDRKSTKRRAAALQNEEW
jgi:hypothetical protein